MAKEAFLNERMRAEDILLGALGFGEEASIVSVSQTAAGYKGIGKWTDGEEFEFESDEAPTELQLWALNILKRKPLPSSTSGTRR